MLAHDQNRRSRPQRLREVVTVGNYRLSAKRYQAPTARQPRDHVFVLKFETGWERTVAPPSVAF
jgi:hypothetical protein